jgi:hypothetical protein
MTMSDNTVFARQLADFLKQTVFPPGTLDEDIIVRTSVAVIAFTTQASAKLKRAYTVADLASQGIGGGIGPHKLVADLLKTPGLL